MLLLCGYYTIITSYAPPRLYDYYIVRTSPSVRLLNRTHLPVSTIIKSYAPSRQYDYYIVRTSQSVRLLHRTQLLLITIITSYATPPHYDYYIVRNSSSLRLLHRAQFLVITISISQTPCNKSEFYKSFESKGIVNILYHLFENQPEHEVIFYNIFLFPA